MKKIFFIILVGLFVSLPFINQSASAADSLTNFPVGACSTANGWLTAVQQKADGTWVTSQSKYNTCNQANTIGRIGADSWLTSGIGYSDPFFQRVNQYPWGTNYPNNNQTYQQYLIDCVLTQSIVARPECSAFPRLANYTASGTNGLLGYLGGGFGATFQNNSSTVSVQTTSTDTKSILMSFLAGWALNHFLN